MDKLLKLKDLAKLTGFSTVTLRRWLKRGTGPRFMKTATGIYLFRPGDIDSWLMSREALDEGSHE